MRIKINIIMNIIYKKKKKCLNLTNLNVKVKTDKPKNYNFEKLFVYGFAETVRMSRNRATTWWSCWLAKECSWRSTHHQNWNSSYGNCVEALSVSEQTLEPEALCVYIFPPLRSHRDSPSLIFPLPLRPSGLVTSAPQTTLSCFHASSCTSLSSALQDASLLICLPPTGLCVNVSSWVCWLIWTTRNKLVYENPTP